jgi:hypothetical protein
MNNVPNREPTFVSFYAGDAYYHESAARLQADCMRFGLRHEIVELPLAPGEDWSDVCRRKIAFYGERYARHEGGIVWLDVDTRILKDPRPLLSGGHDMAIYLRNFRDLRDFDPGLHARTFAPSVIHFAPTPKTAAFLGELCALERGASEKATDDFFLEEAFRRSDQALALLLLPTDSIARGDAPAQDAFFRFGASGNVRHFAPKVVQHTPRLKSTERDKAALRSYASDAAKKGRRGAAIVFMSKAHELDPGDAGVALSLARWLRRDGRAAEGARLLNEAAARDGAGAELLRAKADFHLDGGDTQKLESALDALAARVGEDDGFVRSRRFRLDLEKRAVGMPDSSRTPLWWMETPYPGNFGDVLNPYVIEKLTGVPPRFTPAAQAVLAIGSIIRLAGPGAHVWGAGTPRMSDELSPRARYAAVRGPLTRDLVLRSGGDCPPIYGDPALLLPRLYTPRPRPRRPLGVILHHVHAGMAPPIEGDVAMIDVMRIGYDDLEAFIDEVAACDAILSTSLHGIIVAQAYGVPARWCVLPNAERQIAGDGVKFEDYFLGAGAEPQQPLDLSAYAAITPALASQCPPARLGVDLDALLAAAPLARGRARNGLTQRETSNRIGATFNGAIRRIERATEYLKSNWRRG